MKEPRRLRDGGGDDDLRELLAAGSRPRGMNAHERAMASRQAAKIAAVPVGMLAWWGASKALAAGLATVAVVVGAGVVVAGRAKPRVATTATTTVTAPARPRAQGPRGARAAPSVVTSVPVELPPAPPPVIERVMVRPPMAARSARSAPAVEAPAPTVAEPVEVLPPRPTPAPMPTRNESLGAETGLLIRANNLLRSDPAASLALVDAHTDFAAPALAEEREIIAVIALQRLGRRDEARARGQALIARWPSGTAAARVRSLLSGANARE